VQGVDSCTFWPIRPGAWPPRLAQAAQRSGTAGSLSAGSAPTGDTLRELCGSHARRRFAAADAEQHPLVREHLRMRLMMAAAILMRNQVLVRADLATAWRSSIAISTPRSAGGRGGDAAQGADHGAIDAPDADAGRQPGRAAGGAADDAMKSLIGLVLLALLAVLSAMLLKRASARSCSWCRPPGSTCRWDFSS